MIIYRSLLEVRVHCTETPKALSSHSRIDGREGGREGEGGKIRTERLEPRRLQYSLAAQIAHARVSAMQQSDSLWS
jgi:hypothetical protein